jgi:signal transduction histidine kinase/HPt (histidine-containing phosphotransfer) domain-containing protein/ActR/RegA family two-component response regulator
LISFTVYYCELRRFAVCSFISDRVTSVLRASIRVKISAIVVATTSLSLAVAAAASGWRDFERRFAAKQIELTGMANVLAAAVEPSLLQGTGRHVRQVLRSMGRMRSVTYVRVRNASGHDIASFGSGIVVARRADVTAPNAVGPFELFSLSTFPVQVSIVSSGTQIGDLTLIADVSELRTAFIESLLTALLIGLGASLFGFFVALWLQRFVTKPMRDLAGAMRGVRDTGDYSGQVRKVSADETGDLVDSFNAMLREIRARDGALRDHSETLEQTVELRTRDLATAKAAAESANEAKSEFLATMSHEIRTPMNGMLVMAELLSAGRLDPKLQRYADVIVKSGHGLLAIINDILDLSKIEAGRLDLECVSVDPAIIADDVAMLFCERAASKSLDLAVVVEPGVPRTVGGDPVRLNQILSNLTNNALKFTQAGGVSITVSCPSRACADADKATLRFSVRDTGIGIPDEKICAIFDAFSQADSSTTREYGGTGIGLTICRRLVAAMGGTISASSVVGSGTTFTVDIPCEVISGFRSATRHDVSDRGCVALALREGPTRAAVEAAARALDLGIIHVNPEQDRPVAESVVAIVADSDCVARVRCRFDTSVHAFAIGRFGDTSAARAEQSGDIAGVISWPVTTNNAIDLLLRSLSELPGARRAIADNAARSSSRTFSGLRVLAADDSPINREVLTEALTRLQVEVVSVENGQEARDIVERETFDLVFMDASMPLLDGFQATRAIRAAERAAGRAPVPIIALTAHVVGSRANEWQNAGMVDCVTKPFTVSAIESCLRKWIPDDRHTRNEGGEAGPSENVADGSATRIAGSRQDDPPGTPPVLDPEVLQSINELAGPSNDLTKRLVLLFREHAPIAMDRLHAAIDGKDPVAIASTAHAFKSMCRNIGALELGHILHEIEEAAVMQSSGPPDNVVIFLNRSLEATLAALAVLEEKSTGASSLAVA